MARLLFEKAHLSSELPRAVLGRGFGPPAGCELGKMVSPALLRMEPLQNNRKELIGENRVGTAFHLSDHIEEEAIKWNWVKVQMERSRGREYLRSPRKDRTKMPPRGAEREGWRADSGQRCFILEITNPEAAWAETMWMPESGVSAAGARKASANLTTRRGCASSVPPKPPPALPALLGSLLQNPGQRTVEGRPTGSETSSSPVCSVPSLNISQSRKPLQKTGAFSTAMIWRLQSPREPPRAAPLPAPFLSFFLFSFSFSFWGLKF